MCLAPGTWLTRSALASKKVWKINLPNASASSAVSGRLPDLSSADLTYADLSGADLSGSVMQDARLVGADLRGANLSGAALNDANLSGANLKGATGKSAEQLDGQVGLLEGVIMPDGQRYED